jgi:hypothetical protein
LNFSVYEWWWCICAYECWMNLKSIIFKHTHCWRVRKDETYVQCLINK